MAAPPSDVSTAEPEFRRLGDFELIRELGSGGMGVVYQARQISLNRKVALKVLSGGLGLTPKAVARFHREAEAAGRLHHTNIVPVYTTGEQDGVYFYAMELIEGPSLDQVIRHTRHAEACIQGDGPASEADAQAATGPYVAIDSPSESGATLTSSSFHSDCHYFDLVARMIAEVADALDYAHQQGVIHRDIKPSNLLLSPASRLSLNDFGLARVLEQPGMTLSGEFMGTPRYMSPEQITAGRTPLDHRTDIYSLGATLYELLTLQPPFLGERRDQVLAQILHKEPKPPRKLNKKVPVDLETVCLKAIDKDPDRRYQTAKEMAEDLRRFVNRFAISVRRAGPIKRLRKWVNRRPGLATALAGVVVALVVASYFAQQSWRDRQERLASDKAARLKLLDEKMQQAQYEILQGDFPRAEGTISAAEQLGAPEAWTLWRRGQIAFHCEQYEKAIELLEPAAAQMSDNVALNCMLGSAWHFGRRAKEVFSVESRLESFTPRTPEDLMYKGFFEIHMADGVRGLKALDEAMALQPSLIGHTLRAVVRAIHAQETSDLAGVEAAMVDALAAKDIFPSNPSVLVCSVKTHMYAAGLYALSNKSKEREAAMRVATKDAAELARFPEVTSAVLWRACFLNYDGQKAEAFRVLENAMRSAQVNPRLAWEYAMELFRRGEVEKALNVIELHVRSDPYWGDFTRATYLAELPNGPARAREIYASLMEAHPELWWMWVAIPLWLGNTEEACADVRAREPEQVPQWFGAFYEYLRSPTATLEEDLINGTGRSPVNLTYAHYWVGIRQLAAGDRIGAHRHFQACLATHCFSTVAYVWSRAFLSRMEKDPTWPPWIPVKK
jgi:serine/threonine protein kinase